MDIWKRNKVDGSFQRTVRFLPRLSVFCFAAFLHITVVAQTNLSAVAEKAVTKQVWDYSDQLKFSAEQNAEMETVRLEMQSASEELNDALKKEAPPDVKQLARQKYGQRVLAANKRIAEILTADQKKEFAELRATERAHRLKTSGNPPRVNAGNSSTNETTETDELRSGFDQKKARAALGEGEYKKLAAELRAAYGKPPAQWPAPTIDDEVKPRYVELGLLPPIVYPTNNPFSEAKAELGKKLFFDPRLSGSAQIACASCHEPELGWSDGRTVSFGHERKELRRNAPTILNIGHAPHLFWDGRSESLEEQVIDVIRNEDEMRGNNESVRELLGNTGYTNEFKKVFGSPEITLPRVAQAIATFERTVTSRANAFDQFLRGETNALTDSAVRGLHLFRTTARCAICHFGPRMTDDLFHNEGLTYYGRTLEDLGRYNITKKAEDVGAFKTPTLRNLSRTEPYMHNGLFDLDGVLNIYNAGMPVIRPKADQKNDPLFPKKSPLLHALGLNRNDIADLKAFLESLTETRLRVRPPELPARSDQAAKK